MLTRLVLYSYTVKHNKKAKEKSFTFLISSCARFSNHIQPICTPPRRHLQVQHLRHTGRFILFDIFQCAPGTLIIIIYSNFLKSFQPLPHFSLHPSTAEVKMYRCVPCWNNCEKNIFS